MRFIGMLTGMIASMFAGHKKERGPQKFREAQMRELEVGEIHLKGKTTPRRIHRYRAHCGGPSLRDRILAAGSAAEIRRLFEKLCGYNHNARTLRRCRKAAVDRTSALQRDMVFCSGVAEETVIYAHLDSTVEAGPENALPKDIQWAPPGNHTIRAKQSDGEKVTKTVVVNARGAAALQGFLLTAKHAAQAGTGDAPFFDFDHADGAASAHPVEFYWGGDDPKTGGIRAKLEWTDAGKQAVLGKTYRRFSPAMKLAENGEIIGSEVNMGGLVNRAAFQKIQPIWAKAVADDPEPNPTNKQEHQMKTLLTILAKAGLISSNDLDEASAVSQFQTNHAALLAKQATTETELGTVKAKNTELTDALKVERDRNVVLAKAQATDAVNAAILAKKIEPKNETLIAKYVEMYQADPTGTPNPAFQPVIQAKDASTQRPSGAGATGEHEFLVKAKALAAEQKISQGDASILLAKQQPKLYEDYRDSLVTFGRN